MLSEWQFKLLKVYFGLDGSYEEYKNSCRENPQVARITSECFQDYIVNGKTDAKIYRQTSSS